MTSKARAVRKTKQAVRKTKQTVRKSNTGNANACMVTNARVYKRAFEGSLCRFRRPTEASRDGDDGLAGSTQDRGYRGFYGR
jgi:hypothetical protein